MTKIRMTKTKKPKGLLLCAKGAAIRKKTNHSLFEGQTVLDFEHLNFGFVHPVKCVLVSNFVAFSLKVAFYEEHC